MCPKLEQYAPSTGFEAEADRDPFWNFDEDIGEGIFFGEPTAIRLMAHVAQERYRHNSDLDEIVPLQAKSGNRIYILATPYILLPDYRLTVEPYPRPRKQGAIGEVVGSDWIGMRQQVVGQAQAWHYPEDRTIILWECFLDDWCRQEDPRSDETHKAAWLGFERFLVRHLPNTERIATPSWEPLPYMMGVGKHGLNS